ncbi:hypothetical protein [Parapedobacter tibetensis]|uniref:hypothetical protein n=1 Tax=Parapedobacter tibetensis TaxID=2972951 RepID=UPI00214DA511|nr:hypothetical protein [Parapedobacter tibetensis]
MNSEKVPHKRIALVEVGGSHDECLYSQCLFLHGHADTILVITADLEPRVTACKELVLSVKIFGFQSSQSFQWKNVWKLYRYLLEQKFDRVVFNTAQGGIKKLFILPFPRSMRLIGTIHNTHKFYKGIGQRIISSKIKKYLVLNDYLLPSVASLKGLQFSSYYPAFFPKLATPNQITKPAGETWICIPGQVSLQRRDYLGLIKAVKQAELESRWKFILLGNAKGNDGDMIKQQANELGLQSSFILFDAFVPYELLHAYMQLADAVMPLIHPSTPGFVLYQHHKITGAFNMAFAFKKPLLMEASFRGIEDFKENAIFYDVQTLSEDIFTGTNGQSANTDGTLYQSAKWEFAFQQNNYLAFVLS